MVDDDEMKRMQRAGATGRAAASALLNLAKPGLGLSVRVIEHVREARAERARMKEERFCRELVRGTVSAEDLEEREAKLEQVIPEFADLLAAMHADVDVEKSEVYGCAAVRIACGEVPTDVTRDFIFAVQQARLEDLVFLFEVYVNEQTKQMHEIQKLQSVRHPAMIQRLLSIGCLESREGTAARVSDFGKRVIDWLLSSLPLPSPHEHQGRRRPNDAG